MVKIDKCYAVLLLVHKPIFTIPHNMNNLNNIIFLSIINWMIKWDVIIIEYPMFIDETCVKLSLTKFHVFNMYI